MSCQDRMWIWVVRYLSIFFDFDCAGPEERHGCDGFDGFARITFDWAKRWIIIVDFHGLVSEIVKE